jgi:hypothetical protein
MIPTGPRLLRFLVIGLVAAAFTGCGGGGLAARYLNLSILNSLSLPAGFQGSAVAVQGSLAYVSTEAIGSQSGVRSLVIVSVESPAAPTVLSETSSGLTSDMGGIAVGGNYAYVSFETATGTNFQVWDVSNPRSPSIAGSTSISCPAGMFPFEGPTAYGNLVYLPCWESEVTATGAIAIVDVSNPASPSVAGSVSVTASYQPISFAIWEQNLYVAATQGGSTTDYVLLYSIADPASPRLLAMESVAHSPQSVSALGPVALTPIYDGTELETVDFSSPTSPQIYSAKLGSCHPMSVAVYQVDLAIVPCDSPGGLAEVGVAADGNPIYLGTALSGTVFNVVAASGNYLYGVDESGNFETIGQ